MPFNKAEIDKIYKEHFKPAVEETGFKLRRVDEKPKAGSIDLRMQVEIRNARFIIADLTDANLNVLWEAGFAKGLDKPVIYTCKIGKEHSEKIKKQMFDINHDQYIEWDPKNPEEAVELLKAVIRNTLPTEAKMEDEVAG